MNDFCATSPSVLSYLGWAYMVAGECVIHYQNDYRYVISSINLSIPRLVESKATQTGLCILEDISTSIAYVLYRDAKPVSCGFCKDHQTWILRCVSLDSALCDVLCVFWLGAWNFRVSLWSCGPAKEILSKARLGGRSPSITEWSFQLPAWAPLSMVANKYNARYTNMTLWYMLSLDPNTIFGPDHGFWRSPYAPIE